MLPRRLPAIFFFIITLPMIFRFSRVFDAAHVSCLRYAAMLLLMLLLRYYYAYAMPCH